MEEKIYTLKKNSGKLVYSEFTESLIERNIKPLEKIYILENNNSSFIKIKLPNKSLKALEFILQKFELSEFEEEFLSLICLTQDLYLDYLDIYSDELIQDFKDEKIELQFFLDMVEEYLNTGRKSIHSISFKFNKGNFKPIKNKSLIEEIFNSILINLDLNKENFEQRKQELLTQSVTIKPRKGGEYIKSELIKTLTSFLISNVSGITGSDALRFCGYFLHICQIPSNNVNLDEIILENYENDFKSIDPKNLKHYLTNRQNFFS